jgi:sugar O-acyltransferase (sialic acid O-acetyltransferase NeuD family)
MPAPLPSPRFLAILGAGGHGKAVLDVALAGGRETIRIFDDRLAGGQLLNLPVEPAAALRVGPGFDFVVAIGDNATRKREYERLLALGGNPVTLIHPRAWVSPYARVDAGTVVLGGAIINAGASIGINCIINTLAGVDHDVQIDAHVHIGPGASLAGQVQIGTLAMIGLGARLIPQVAVGESARIGAGAVVLRPVPAGALAYGVPARIRG